MLFFTFVSLVQTLEVLLAILDFDEESIAHFDDLLIHALVWQWLEALSDAAKVLFLACILDPLFRLTHDSLVHAPLLCVYERFVSLLKEMKCVRRPLMPALIRMDQDGQHSESLSDFSLIRLWSNLKYVIRIDELLVAQ